LISSADKSNSGQASRPFTTASKTQPKTPRSAILHSSTVPIADLRTRLAERKSTERSLKVDLSLLSSVTSTSDLRSTVDALKAQKEGLLERLTQLKKAEAKPVSEAEKSAVRLAHKTWEKHASGRKRIFKDLWYKRVDHLPDSKTKKEVLVCLILEPEEVFPRLLTEHQEELGCEGSMEW
jgi:predicted metal-dependent hydrolase